MSEPIYAPCTPAGGAIQIVRLSGKGVIPLVANYFRPVGLQDFAEAAPRRAYYGTLHDGNTPQAPMLDEIIATAFRAPHSYTGEDVVELALHGSPYILRRTLALLSAAGARMAEPGEFTKRAFLAGRLDLSQAEAVASLISAQSAAAHRVALSQMRGGYRAEIQELREHLLHLTSLVELELDFADHEDLEFASRQEIQDLVEEIIRRIERLTNSFRLGRTLKEGLPVAIVGETNVGKSTLLNALLHEERAIVSDVHGTTRDVIEDTITLANGITYRFIDTAGLRDTNDHVENLGIERTYQKIQEAEIILWLIDATRPQTSSSHIAQLIKKCEGKQLLHVYNKSDLATPQHAPLTPSLHLSAKTGEGLNALEQWLIQAAPDVNEEIVVTEARHQEALLAATRALHLVRDALRLHTPTDLLATDLRYALHHLATIVGEITPEATLQNIFQHFCLGK